MPDIAVVTDSIACLTQELISQYQIEIIPMNVFAGGKVYRDWIDLSPSQAYELLLKTPDSFKAAPATPEECVEIFRRVSQRASKILCVTVSVKISTLFNVAHAAIEKVRAELPGTRIEILDSETATAAQGFVALAAARAAEAGKPFEEVLESAKTVKQKVNVVVILDTMRYVYRSGRVPRIAAQAASVLNIHPIFTISGTVHFATAAATKKNGIDRIVKMMHDKVGEKPIHCAVMHAYDPEGAKRLKDRVAVEFDCVELWISEFSPIMGYATGTGTLGLAFYVDS